MATGLTSQMTGMSAALRVRPCTGPSRVFGAAVVPPRPLALHRPAAQLQQSESCVSSSVQVRRKPACRGSERSGPDLPEMLRDASPIDYEEPIAILGSALASQHCLDSTVPLSAFISRCMKGK